MTNQEQSQAPSTLHLPRILCLHGGGTNARIFRAQCRRLTASLESEFRFVFVEAPFSSTAGSDVMSVYNQWGPFKRWLRWRLDQPVLSHAQVVREIDHAMEDEMNRDDLRGATGDWVGLLGFSQGAMVAASVLYRQQFQEGTRNPSRIGAARFRFGVLFAGRAPLVWLEDTLSSKPPGLADASFATDIRGAHPEQVVEFDLNVLLRIPSLHVHGLRDEGIDLHRQLLELCDPDSRRLVELDLEHRLPLKSGDVAPVVREIRHLAKKTGGGLGGAHHSRMA
ncbi:hypothetical protein CIB48_g4820 [Xylaria polymorpha]|nr:hypothetical protein CIB48_g4820 [Xylaria polymorpha]